MIHDMLLWILTLILGGLVLMVVWRVNGKDEIPVTEKKPSKSFQQNENFIRCHAALQTLLFSVLPALQSTIDSWHQTTSIYIPQCTGTQPNQCSQCISIQPGQCPPFKKPSVRHPVHSCQGCIAWANAIEAAVYPQSAKGSLQWRNAKPALFHQDRVEVMKLFALRLPDVNQTYSSLGDFDTASVLTIMARFAPFHGSTQTVYEKIMKVSEIRNSLAHLKLNKNLHLDDRVFEAHWKDITDLVNLIQGLGKAYFTQKTAQGLCDKLTEIKNQTISPQIEEEALRPLIEYIVLKTMEDERKQGDPLDVPSCKKRLKATYRTKRRGIGFLPGFPKEFSSDEFFVDLELSKKQKFPTKVQDIPLKTYTDLLQIQDERGQKLYHVLVSGSAGTGKTTLVSRLAYQWATAETESEGNDTALVMLISFQLVFALDIRQFRPNMDLVDAVRDQLLRHVSKHQLQEYLSVNAESCLFLFDGYDELSSDEVVLNSGHLCSSYVIVTTRPNKVDIVCGQYQGYVQVDLRGFSEESISSFVHKFFGEPRVGTECVCNQYRRRGSDSSNNCSKSTELLKRLDSSTLPQDLSRYPLLLAMICVIYKDQNVLPNTMSALFTSLIEFLVCHWKAREPGFQSKSLEQFKSEIGFDDFMILLGKTSLDGLIDNDSKLIFREDEFESFTTLQKGYSLGVLSNVSRLSGFYSVRDVFFIHKTLQEYCAAMYLASIVDSEPTLFKQIIRKMNLSDMKYVLRFCCGLSQEVAERILVHMSDMNIHSLECVDIMKTLWSKSETGDDFTQHETKVLRIQCKLQSLAIRLLFESELRHGVNLQMHRILKPLISFFVFKYIDVPTFRYFSNNSHSQNGWLNDVEIAVNDQVNHNMMFAMIMKMPNLSTLFLYYVDIETIISLPQHTPHLKALHIRLLDTRITESAFDPDNVDSTLRTDTVLNMFQWANALSEFSITRLELREGGDNDSNIIFAQTVIKTPTLCKVQYIRFHRVLLESDVELMCDEMVKYCKNTTTTQQATQLPLKEFDLSRNQVGRASSQLAEAIKFMGSLKKLKLRKTGLNELHFQVFCPSLSHLRNLETLDLSENTIGDSLPEIMAASCQTLDLSDNTIGGSSNLVSSDSGCTKLAEALQSMASLRKLKLRKTGLNELHFQVFCPSLSHLRNLETLDLSENTIGDSLPEIMAASCQTLDLSDNTIGGSSNLVSSDSGCTKLAEALQSMASLRKLKLRETGLNEVHFQVLCPSFSHLLKLEKLDLSHNTIGDSLPEILVAISESKMQWLNLKYTGLSVRSRYALNQIDETLPQLSVWI